ncbi:MAG: biotin/lipoyl-binding protein, partial [Pseudomonadota bacterium]|nr:biotin/lipoyl-binding protein [Pseudomonadota bacterium]
VDNMRVAMDAVRDSGRLCEAAICYTGDLTDPACTKYDLNYYVTMARELERAGAHILGIKDMAGVCKPAAARMLVKALREETGLPVHFHTHDTSGIAAASVLAAVEAGADAVDGAMDAMSGLTSQPNLGAMVEALRAGPRDPGLPRESLRVISRYWEVVRQYYAAFESDIRAGTADVYRHAMPGGQYTNLREQARALGLEHHWPEVAEAYAQVNELFGDIVKVTPTSKVVGDMALMMVTSGLTPADVTDPAKDIAFPESVVSMFRGDLGQPPGGWPKDLQRKILKGQPPLTVRPGEVLPPADLDRHRQDAEAKLGRRISDAELSSHLLYPKVFEDYASHRRDYGNVSVLPTPVFFYGMEAEQEVAVDIDVGKTLLIRYLATSGPDSEGRRTVFFELNGQPRNVKVTDQTLAHQARVHPRAQEGNPDHVAAPMPGLVVSVHVTPGQRVQKGDLLASIEAMKMETAIHAERSGVVKEIVAPVGTQVDVKDLLLVVAEAA